MSDDEDARKKRADDLRKKIGELKSVPPAPPGSDDVSTDASKQRPGESDAEYVHRRMREIDRKPKGV